MRTVADVLRIAKSQVGVVERGGRDGRSGNIVKYWAELCPSCQGQPWCACYQRWVDKHAGGPLLPVPNPYYCPSVETYARNHGLLIAKTGVAHAGDYVLFDFDGAGHAQHIGRLTRDYPGHGPAYTNEGNTSPGNAGSQRNGGGVYERVRPASVIRAFVAYSRLLAHPAVGKPATSAPPRKPVRHNPFPAPSSTLRPGARGDVVRWVQWAVGVPVDGVWGAQTTSAVKYFQHQHRLVDDGVVGPTTRSALARITH
ncbi:MAG: peptidoglycan-binding protein [Frankia sp.]|nr:peptidoglycan-binding protein [Frankia sp.]